MLPVSEFLDSVTIRTVRRSCKATGSVPLRPRPDSHSPAIPPVCAVLLYDVEGESVMNAVSPPPCQSWQ